MGIVWDIETGPLADDELARAIPAFVPPPHPGVFNSAAVKTGNATKAETIASIIERAAEKHASEVEQYETTVKEAKAAYYETAKAKAALSPLTGQILAIGFLEAVSEKVYILGGDDGETEQRIISKWLDIAGNALQGGLVCGWNSTGFDWPFLVQRAWKHGIDIRQHLTLGRWGLPDTAIDLMAIFNLNRRGAYTKLDEAARFLGVEGKLAGVDGSMFASLWTADREKAVHYLESDLRSTFAVAQRMHVL